MPRPIRFRNVRRFGRVQVATFRDPRGREIHTAVCTTPACGFSAEYASRPAAELAARRHRCTTR